MDERQEPKRRVKISKTVGILIVVFLLFTWPFGVILYNSLPEFSHKGTERYAKEKCASCRSGKDFYNIVDSHNLEQAGEIVNFVHQYDTFLWPNCYEDIYVLDVQCSDQFEDYESYVKSYITYEGQQSIVNHKGSFYLVLVDRPSVSEYVIFAVNDTDRIIRCIYIAGYAPTEPLSLHNILNYDLGCVNWGQGDGSVVPTNGILNAK